MKNTKERQQIIMLSVVLALIGIVLLYFYHDKFLPKPVGDPVVLTPPQRLLIPPRTDSGATLYQQPDFQSLRDHTGVPVKPEPLNSSGNPFLEDVK